ncbi:MAG: low temperature requirement protein A [Phototrophicaceae bacterium]
MSDTPEKSPMFTAPRPFGGVTFHRHTLRNISWLELYYDLIYVATFIQIGNFLSKHVDLNGFTEFLIMLTAVWWAWSGTTFFQNRFVADDWQHRLLVFLQIFGVAALGISVSDAFGDLYIQFTVAYVLTRVLLVIMYLRMARLDPPSASLSNDYAIAFGVGGALWLASLLLPLGYHWVGWIAAIVVELVIPIVPRMAAHQQLAPIDPHHLEERFGIFTIIVLGEAFVKVLDDAQGTVLGPDQFIFSVFGLVVTFALWWLYFTDTVDHGVDFKQAWRAPVWFYGHLPLAAGLVTFGVAAKKFYAATLEHPGEALHPEYRLLYTAGLLLYLVALVLIDMGTHNPNPQSDRIQLVTRLVSIALVAGFGLFATEFDAIQLVIAFALIFAAQVGVSVWLHLPGNYIAAHRD